MAKPGATGVIRIVKATKYSYLGIRAALKNEAAFRQESALAIIMIIASIFLANSAEQFVLLLSGPFIVMIAEILNSAIEAIVDRIGNEYHELSGRAKDMGSAAVFIALTYTVVSWVVIIMSNYGIVDFN
jgi:diacylglycerol kinase (ATP)